MHRFDTDTFRAAMEEAIATAPSPASRATLLAELAIEGAQPYMWRRPPATADVEAWARAALDGAADTYTRATALLATGYLDSAANAAPAREGVELAAGLEDVNLRARSYLLMVHVATDEGKLADARGWVDRALELLPAVDDPDRREGILFYAVFVYLRLGLVAEARRLADLNDEQSLALTVHHQVHGVAGRMLAATITGAWEDAVALAERAERSAAANLDTPCQFNWRAVVMAALAAARAGDDRAARTLEERGLELAGPEASLGVEPALLRLALARGDLGAVERTLAATVENRFDVDVPAATIDARAALGDRDGVEREAAKALALGGLYEPFALRALGTVRGDRELVARAVARFEQLGLAWHAAETRETAPV
jgi:hypothetical protein